MSSRRIAFVINSLGAGGAERVMCELLRAAPRDGWLLDLILLDQEEERRTPPDDVRVHRLDCRFSLLTSISRLRATLAEIRPDLVVSFLVRANVASVIATRLLSIPCVISERAHLSSHLDAKYSGPRRTAAAVLPRLTYPLAEQVIAVSEGVGADLARNFGVAADRLSAIPNPYDLARIAEAGRAEPEFPVPPRFIVSSGRLTASKGFEDLIGAYAMGGIL